MILTLVYFIDFTDNLQHSGSFKDTLNYGSPKGTSTYEIWELVLRKWEFGFGK